MNKGKIFNFTTQIREHHLDTFGHVNNAKYLEILEDARWDLLTNQGFGLQEVHKRKVGPIVLEIELKFKKELRNREKITITTQCISYDGKVGKMMQTILKEDNEISCTALFTIALLDWNTRRIIQPTEEWLSLIGLA